MPLDSMVSIDEHGRVNIPARMREKLDLQPGENVITTIDHYTRGSMKPTGQELHFQQSLTAYEHRHNTDMHAQCGTDLCEGDAGRSFRGR